jgi:hypothetical protein
MFLEELHSNKNPVWKGGVFRSKKYTVKTKYCPKNCTFEK